MKGTATTTPHHTLEDFEDLQDRESGSGFADGLGGGSSFTAGSSSTGAGSSAAVLEIGHYRKNHLGSLLVSIMTIVESVCMKVNPLRRGRKAQYLYIVVEIIVTMQSLAVFSGAFWHARSHQLGAVPVQWLDFLAQTAMLGSPVSGYSDTLIRATITVVYLLLVLFLSFWLVDLLHKGVLRSGFFMFLAELLEISTRIMIIPTITNWSVLFGFNTTRNELVFFPEREAFSMPTILTIIAAPLVLLIVFSVFSLRITTYFPGRGKLENYSDRFTFIPDLVLIGGIFVVSVLVSFFQTEATTGVASLLCICFLFYGLIHFVPFKHRKYTFIVASQYGLYLGGSLFLVISSSAVSLPVGIMAIALPLLFGGLAPIALRILTRNLAAQADEILLCPLSSRIGHLPDAEDTEEEGHLQRSRSSSATVLGQSYSFREDDADIEELRDGCRQMFQSSHHALRLIRWYSQSPYPSLHMERVGLLISLALDVYSMDPHLLLVELEFKLTCANGDTDHFEPAELIPCFKKLRALTARLDWHEDVVFIGLLENRLQLQSTGVGELSSLVTRLRKQHGQIIQLTHFFWKSLLQTQVDLSILPKIVETIEREEQLADESFEISMRTKNQEPDFLRAYASYLETVKHDRAGARRFYESADFWEENNRRRHRDKFSRNHSHEPSGDIQPMSSFFAANRGERSPRVSPPRERRDKKSSKGLTLTKSEVPGKIASAMSIERGLFENDGFDEEEGHVSTTRLLASSSTSPPTVKSSLKRPSSTLDFRERHVSEADDLTDAHTMDTSTDMSADDEDGAAFAKVKYFVEKAQEGRASTRIRIAVVLSLAVIGAVAVAVFVVQQVMVGEAVKGVELLTSAGDTRMSLMRALYNVRSLDVLINKPSRTFYMDKGRNELRQKMGLTYFEFFRQRTFNYSLATAQLSADLFTRSLDDGDLLNFWRDIRWEVEVWDKATDTYSMQKLSLWRFYQELSRNLYLIAELTPEEWRVGGYNITAYRFVVDNAPMRALSAIWSLTTKYQESFGEKLERSVVILWALVGVSLAVPILLFFLVFFPAFRKIRRARRTALHMFKTIPKAVISKIHLKLNNTCQSLVGKRVQSTARLEAQIVERNQRWTSLSKLSFVFVFVISCGTAFLLASLIMTILSFEKFRANGPMINYNTGRRSLAFTCASHLQEFYEGSRVVDESVAMWPLDFLMEIQRALKYGSSSLKINSFLGKYPAQDDLFFKPRCNDMGNFLCQPLDYLVHGFVAEVRDLILDGDKLNYTSPIYQSLIYRLDAPHGIEELLEDSRKIFYDQEVNDIESNDTVVSALFGVLLAGLVIFYIFLLHPMLKKVRLEVMTMQKMLLLIPLRVVNEVPTIRDYLLRGNTNVNSSSSKHGKEDRSRSYLFASVDPVVEINEEGIILTNNHHICELFQIQEGESGIVGTPLYDLLNNGRTSLLNMIHSLKETVDLNDCQDMEGRKADGSVFPLRVSMAKGWRNDARIFVVFLSDISGEHLQEELMEQQELVSSEKAHSEELLLNILPASIAARLKGGVRTVADGFDNVTTIFIDMVSFTSMSGGMSPEDLVNLLDDVFIMMDNLAEQHRIEKIKTIGDCFMAVGGLFDRQQDHAEAVVDFALDVMAGIARISEERGRDIRLRAGISSGPLVAGVIGKIKFAFDVWGDCVTVASRMESGGVPGRVQVSRKTYEKIFKKYDFEEEREVEIKQDQKMLGYLVVGKKPEAAGLSPSPLPNELAARSLSTRASSLVNSDSGSLNLSRRGRVAGQQSR